MRQSKNPLCYPDSTPPQIADLNQRIVADACCPVPDNAQILAAVEFLSPSEQRRQPSSFYCELAPIAMPRIAEQWLVGQSEVSSGSRGGIQWAASNHFLFLGITLDCPAEADVTALTAQGYAQLLAWVAASDAPHLVRCWNYVPHINAGTDAGESDNEIYKRFCTGRLLAFEQAGLAAMQFPSASAVGHSRPSLTIQVLSSRFKGRHFGNHKQVDAFCYPREYGKSSPSFARATLLTQGMREMLFISGTASIIGHASQHEGDLSAQLRVTCDNITQLLKQTGKTPQAINCLRVYLRYSQDYATAKSVLAQVFPSADTVFVQADICRRELLVEIECFCG